MAGLLIWAATLEVARALKPDPLATPICLAASRAAASAASCSCCRVALTAARSNEPARSTEATGSQMAKVTATPPP